MTIHGLQLDIAWEDPARNCTRVNELLSATPPAAGDLVVLPELFATGFTLNTEAVAAAQIPTELFCTQLAIEHGITLIAGIGRPGDSGRALNEAVVFGPDGETTTRYAKLHPFSYGRETEAYDAGEKVVTFRWDEFKVAPFVCYDLRFPEVFREAKAELYCIGANWPAARAEHWNVLLRARAIENQAYVIGVNRCGSDPHLQYAGGSLIIGPRGEVLAEAGETEGLISAPVSAEEMHAYREEFPALKDRRDHSGRA